MHYNNLPMQVPFLDLKAQYTTLRPEADEAIGRVLASCAFAGGPEVEAFEKAFANYCEVDECMGVGSGTGALELILRAYGIGPGDDVITAANTFFATAEAISLVGARPVLIDADEGTALMDHKLLEKAITSQTKAVIPVHLFGQPADMDSILEIARKYKLIVIEDSCQAHGARYKGRKTGSLSDSAAFSFYPGKNLGAYGEAGAVTTNDPHIAERIRMLRDHGMPRKYQHELVGRNDRMDGIQGAILGVKLRHLDGWNEARRRHAAQYRSLLGDCDRIKLIKERGDSQPVYHLFVARVTDRDRVLSELKEAGIATGIHYPIPIHLQRAYEFLGYKEGSFPVSETLALEMISLPMFAELSQEQICFVADTLKRVVYGGDLPLATGAGIQRAVHA